MKHYLYKNRAFIAFLLMLGLFRTAIADWNPIPSGSMRPNLLEGDVVFISRLAYDLKFPLTDIIVFRLGEPQRGDIVTFSSPKDGLRMIKRIVALPGDTVEMRGKKLVINGVAAPYAPIGNVIEQIEPYGAFNAARFAEKLGAEEHIVQWLPGVVSQADFSPITIPKDHFLMLGDNRDNSADSRYYGLVPRRLLIGQANRVLVSADIQNDWSPRIERFGKALK